MPISSARLWSGGWLAPAPQEERRIEEALDHAGDYTYLPLGSGAPAETRRMSEARDSDYYDALFAVMQADMPRMWRRFPPEMLASLKAQGALTIAVTDTGVVVSTIVNGAAPQ